MRQPSAVLSRPVGVVREFDISTRLLYDRRRHAGRLITFHDISKLAKAERDAAEALVDALSELRAEVAG